MPEIDEFIEELDKLPASARTARLAKWAISRAEEGREAVCETLSGGDRWRRGLALQLAAFWRLDSYLIAGLNDTSVRLRRRAARLSARFVQDRDALISSALRLDLHTLSVLTQAISRHRRADLAMALSGPLLERGEVGPLRSMVALFTWSRVREVEAVLGFKQLPWRRLSQSQPEEVLAYLSETLMPLKLAKDRQVIWSQVSRGLPALMRREPSALIELLKSAPPQRFSALTPILSSLLDHAPDLVMTFAEELDKGSIYLMAGRRLKRNIRALDDASLAKWAQSHRNESSVLFALFRSLPPSRRGLLFSSSKLTISDRTLALLPHDLRHAEVRRRLAFPSVKRDIVRQRELSAWLPIEEARSILVPQGRPGEREGHDRVTTWRLWIEAVGRERQGMDALLKATRFVIHEQDVVRRGVLMALTRVPIHLFQEQHVDALEALARSVVEARDTSPATLTELIRLSSRLMTGATRSVSDQRFSLALKILSLCFATSDVLRLPDLYHGLPRGAEQDIVQAVLGSLKANISRVSYSNTLNLASALGPRAWGVPELQALLGEVATHSEEPQARDRAVTLWLEPQSTRDERVKRLLELDESSAVHLEVWRHLCLKRTDYLDPYLEAPALKGRWGSEGVGWVPLFVLGCSRWSQRQQRTFAQSLTRVIHDSGQPTSTRAEALKKLALLPVVSVAELAQWTTHEEVPIIEAALYGLSITDEPMEALPELLNHLGGDRARVAMYALPRLTRLLSVETIERLLSDLLSQPHLKVTVHKEAIRLVGALRLPSSSALLEAEWSRPKLHRDVRIALLHAAWRRLDEAWTWSLIEGAVTHPDPEVVEALCQVESHTIPVQHHERLINALLRLETHPEAKARRALCLHLKRDTRGFLRLASEESARVAARLLLSEAPGSPVIEVASGALVLAGSLNAKGGKVVDEAVRALVERVSTEDPVALSEKDEDQTSWRRVELVVTEITRSLRSGWPRSQYKSLGRRISKRLTGSRAWLYLRAELELSLHAGKDNITPFLALLDEAPSELERWALSALIQRAVLDRYQTWAPKTLLKLEEALPPEALAFRYAFIVAGGARHEWPKEFRARLGALRLVPELAGLARAVRVD